jgi:peptide-methionine (R)-S-oxide reductase
MAVCKQIKVKSNCSIKKQHVKQPVLSLTDTLEESGENGAEWKKEALQTINITFCVKGTERPYQNEFNDNHKKGTILCCL